MNRYKRDLKEILHDIPLKQALLQKRAIDKTKNGLSEVIQIMRDTDIEESVIEGVQRKREEYIRVSKCYGNLLNDAWDINQEREKILLKYINYSDEEIDNLPEYVSW